MSSNFTPDNQQGEARLLLRLPLTRELLAVSRAWRARLKYTGPYLLPPGSALSETPHYTIHALHRSLENAEPDAGIDKIKCQAGYGFRLELVGNPPEASDDTT